MKVHVLQHVDFEGLGSIAGWLDAHGGSITHTRFFERSALPPLTKLDLIVATGGPMSVNDEEALPWLRREKEFVRDAMRRGVPVLGICLGAQLIAAALGARVYRLPQKEIGWFPIQAVSLSSGEFRLPERCEVFHWHGETFDLPAGAVRLASSAPCENQAFQVGRRTVALQFHLEATPDSVEALLENCSDELAPGPHVQTLSALRAVPDQAYAKINSVMDQVLSYLLIQ